MHEIFIKSAYSIDDVLTPDESFVKNVAKDASWLFDAPQLREKLFVVSEVKVKHKVNSATRLKNLEKASKQLLIENKARI